MAQTIAAYSNLGTGRSQKVFDINDVDVPAVDLTSTLDFGPSAPPIEEPTSALRSRRLSLPTAPTAKELAGVPSKFSGTADDYMALPAGKTAGLMDITILGEGESPDQKTGMGIPDFMPKEYTGSPEGLDDLTDEQIKSLESVNVTGTPPAPRAHKAPLSLDQQLAIEQQSNQARAQLHKRASDMESLTAAKRQIDETHRALRQRMDLLGGDSAKRKMETFVKQAQSRGVGLGGRLADVLEKQNRGEELSRRERALIASFTDAARTLEQMQETEAALAEIPFQRAEIDTALSELAQIPVVMPEEVAQSLEGKFQTQNEGRARAEQERQRVEARRQASDLRREKSGLKSEKRAAEMKVKPYSKEGSDERNAIEDKAAQAAEQKGWLVRRGGRLVPRDDKAKKAYANLTEKMLADAQDDALGDVDLGGIDERLSEIDMELQGGGAQSGAIDPADVQSLMDKYGVSEDTARQALLQAE